MYFFQTLSISFLLAGFGCSLVLFWRLRSAATALLAAFILAITLQQFYVFLQALQAGPAWALVFGEPTTAFASLAIAIIGFIAAYEMERSTRYLPAETHETGLLPLPDALDPDARAASVLHAYNNLAAIVSGHIELAMDDLPENHPSAESLAKAKSCITAFKHRTADDARPHAEPAAPADAESPTGTGNILIVDDEKELAELGCQILQRMGYHATSMTHSEDVLRAFRSNPAAFDLVISDMNMPGPYGDEVALALHELNPELPIILTSGVAGEDGKERAAAAGACAFLRKPVAAADLTQTIDRFLPRADRD